MSVARILRGIGSELISLTDGPYPDQPNPRDTIPRHDMSGRTAKTHEILSQPTQAANPFLHTGVRSGPLRGSAQSRFGSQR